MKKILLIVLLLLSAQIGYCQEEKQPLQLVIKSDKETYIDAMDAPIIITGEIRNVSDHDLFVYALEQSLTVTYDVIDPKGEKVEVALPIIDLWPPKKDDFTLIKAGKSVSKIFKLYPDLIQSKVSGTYIISVKYEFWDEGYYEDGKSVNLYAWTGTLQSNSIKIEIKKSSPSQLSPWTNKAPYPYENEDRQLVKDSYSEEWVKSSPEEYPEAIRKSMQVLSEWGQDPEKYKYEGKQYDYEITVFESPSFISISFNPLGLDGLERHAEIRMTKKGFEVLSILPGA